MKPASSPRVRQLLAVAGLGIAFVATVATSSSATPMPSSTAGVEGRLSVDSEHGMASQLFRLTIPAEADAARASISTYVDLGAETATDPSGRSIDAAEAVDIRVVAVDPAAETGRSPDPRDSQSSQEFVLGRASPEAEFRVNCGGPGPCDRAYRVIVSLRPGAATAAVSWKASAVIAWSSHQYPNVRPILEVRSPMVVSGPGPVTSLSTAPETIALGRGHPTSARLLELRFTPISGMGYVPKATLTSGLSPTPSSGAADASPTRSSASPPTQPRAVVDFYPVDFGYANPNEPTPLRDGADVFEGCEAGRECVRQVLVALSWLSGSDARYTWNLTLHRTDIERTFTEPEGVVTIKLIERFDPSEAATGHLHFEGDLPLGGANPSIVRTVCIPQPNPGAATPSLGRYLPIAAAARLTFGLKGQLDKVSVAVDWSRQDLTVQADALGVFQKNPFAEVSSANTRCTSIEFHAYYYWNSNMSPLPTSGFATLHWTIDVDVYSYPGVSYTINEATPTPAPSR